MKGTMEMITSHNVPCPKCGSQGLTGKTLAKDYSGAVEDGKATITFVCLTITVACDQSDCDYTKIIDFE